MRRKPENAALPKGVYFKHGAYYRVTEGRWYRLGETLESIAGTEDLPMSQAQILRYLERAYRRARNNALGRRGIPFTLTAGDVSAMIEAGDWKCAVTHLQFSLEVVAGQRPYAPSIDRRDSSLGYDAQNCRVVCVAANYAMNVWGDAVLHKMLDSMRRNIRHLKDRGR